MRIAIGTGAAEFAVLACGPVLTLITEAHPLGAGAVVVAEATLIAPWVGPPQVADAHVVQWPRTVAVHTVVETSAENTGGNNKGILQAANNKEIDNIIQIFDLFTCFGVKHDIKSHALASNRKLHQFWCSHVNEK